MSQNSSGCVIDEKKMSSSASRIKREVCDGAENEEAQDGVAALSVSAGILSSPAS